MKKYLGVKMIEAEPGLSNCSCDRIEGDNSICKCQKEGYKVKYEDEYTSWSPKDVFEKAYKKVKNTLPSFHILLLPYQERVIDEATELKNKINKLNGFIYNDSCKGLHIDEQVRLKQQIMAMQYYLTILIERIENF